MKLKLKKDIIIPKGTIFEKLPDDSIPFYRYDTLLNLDKHTYLRIITSSEDKEYFKVIK